MSEIIILANACKGVEDCGICLFVCPKELFEPSRQMNARGFVPPQITDEAPCTVCLSCMDSCPDMAIVVTKKKKSGKTR